MKVSERIIHETKNGAFDYKEIESSLAKAEKLIGKKLDRRRNYMIIDNQVCETVSWTQSCSGCYESNEGYVPMGNPRDKNGIPLGSGCNECGYQGKVRNSIWQPIAAHSAEREKR